MKEEVPQYLEGKRKSEDREMIERFRCGNETANSRRKKKKKCGRICGKKEETKQHV